MRKKSVEQQDDATELEDSVILGITPDGAFVYIHSFPDDIQALEFIETLTAGFRAEVLMNINRRFSN